MSDGNVVLIAFQDQENLGIGYLTSALETSGYKVRTIDFRLPFKEICGIIIEINPLLVGISVIFQYHLKQVKELVHTLRKGGVECHITVGGHYPSLRYDDFLDSVSGIDSIVRFEGEITLNKLVETIARNQDWKKVEGIAYRDGKNAVSNPLRPLITNLDEFRFPKRIAPDSHKCVGIRCASMIASRGCIRDCAFCSVRRFYTEAPGPLRRTRSPKSVVDEMRLLYLENYTPIFIFQDDDFLGFGDKSVKWTREYIELLQEVELADKILWKISCRSDEIEFDLFQAMKGAGLRFVYLGIESGTQNELNIMNKQLDVQDNLRAVSILKKLNIGFDFGFMLFEPWSTFDSIRDNLKFLRRIAGDGSTPVVLGRMIPYAGTAIEAKLQSEKRLKGTVVNPDYDFLDRRIDKLYSIILETFESWMFSEAGLLSQLRFDRFQLAVLRKFYSHFHGIDELGSNISNIVKQSNRLFIDVCEQFADLFEDETADSDEKARELMKACSVELNSVASALLNAKMNFQQAVHSEYSHMKSKGEIYEKTM